MQLETYDHRNRHHHKKRIKLNLIIFIAFIFVASAIVLEVYSTNDNNFTGFSILPQSSHNATAPINASLSIPHLTLKNIFPELQIKVGQESSIIIGGKTFSLTKSEREIIFKNFDGTISFDEDNIYILKGKASEVILSGIPIKENGKNIEVEIETETKYKNIKIPNEFNMKELNYIASGTIQINQDTIKTNSEEIFLKNYIGNLEIINKELLLNGKIESVKVIGENRKLTISQ